MSPAWRFVIDGPGDGAWNMAVDTAILEAHEAGDVPPTVRLYTWTYPTVSLGRFQKLDSVDVPFCQSNGLALVRRPTGGRGVIHDREVTYSIVAGVRDGLPRGVAKSYRFLCTALVTAFRLLGVSAELTNRSGGYAASGACYLHTTQADLSVGAAKLSGSAQVWHKDSCLQHGSFVVTRDVTREAAVFKLDANSAQALRESTRTLADALGRIPSQAEITEAIRVGVSTTFGINLKQEDSLSRAEVVQAEAHRNNFLVFLKGVEYSDEQVHNGVNAGRVEVQGT